MLVSGTIGGPDMQRCACMMLCVSCSDRFLIIANVDGRVGPYALFAVRQTPRSLHIYKNIILLVASLRRGP